MASRNDWKRFQAMDIDHGAIGLEQSETNTAYFCTPVGAEYVGWIGCDGVHFVLLPGDERVFCVDPMGDQYVLPVGADFREFVSFLLYCKDANPLSQLGWMDEEQFRRLLREDAENASLDGEYRARKEKALAALAAEFQAEPEDPYERVKALQAGFDPSGLVFSDEYYDVLGLENPRGGSDSETGRAYEIQAELHFES